jgi:hypothetical protein
MIQIDDRVKILDSVYEGSTDPTDFEARGKIGRVVYVGTNGDIEVMTDDDNEFYPLTVDEVKVIEEASDE